MEANEIVNVVSILNNEIFDAWANEEYPAFEFSSCGMECQVLFLGISIWQESEDEREYTFEDEKESLDLFLRRKAMEIVQNISKITL
jgi:hypothetical protein